MQWLGIDFTELANAVIVLLAAVIGWIAVKIGRRTPKPESQQLAALQMEGAAIVSSEPVMMLARAIEANNTITIQTQAVDHEKIQAIEGLTREIAELRHEMARRR